MRTVLREITMAAALVLLANTAGAGGPPSGPLKKCPVDAVVAGTTCMDKYEASVWRVPDPLNTNKGLVKKIQQGKATAARSRGRRRDAARRRGRQLRTVR